MFGAVADVLYLVVWLFVLIMFVRLVLEWVQAFARDWRPRGVWIVVFEVVYTVTDPPLRLVRRFVPPLTIGAFRLDLAFMIVLIACYILMALLSAV
ncbi:YggT family protein [Cellulomonas sp. KRMCY2]|uniref:YggT family protein n=1 Tax=Cellulomonas sp. KRMCY2 TaxID=1304865 RepID=UPI00045E6206|nr:YggT family protein [Cellulomonas sp. KRMCY2]